MTSKPLSRRDFLRLASLTAGSALLSACAPGATPTVQPEKAAQPTDTPIPALPTATTAPTPTPAVLGTGKTEITVWYQDWDGANRILTSITPKFVESHPDVKVVLQAIGYTDLMDKMLPAVASGTEGDVLMLYTDWVVGTDVTKVFLDITEPAGGYSFWEKKMFPEAFNAIDLPRNHVFYLPWLAGIRAAAVSVNKTHLAEKNIDYLNFKTFDDVTNAAIQLTQTDADGKMTRSGYSPVTAMLSLVKAFIWQLGGNWFDRENGKFSFNSPEGEQAAQVIYDLFWKHKVCAYGLFDNEFNGVSQNLISMWGDGAWTASVQHDAAKIDADNIPTPPLMNAKETIWYPEHIACWALSKRLTSDKTKLNASLDYALMIVSKEALLIALDFYSGTVMSKELYSDPVVETAKYGPVSKRVAESIWPSARYSGDHIANYGPAAQELDRAMRKEISIKEALANMDKYLQEQEDQARERIS